MEVDRTEGIRDPKEDSKLAIPGAIIVAGIIIGAAVLFTGGDASQPESGVNYSDILADSYARGAARAEYLEPVSASDHLLGSPAATLTLVEYSDFDCPFCQQFHIGMKEVMDEYAKDGKLSWV